MTDPPARSTDELTVDAGGVALPGDLTDVDDRAGVVVFAHGSGSSRRSPRNRDVAARLQDAGLATLLFDLLTDDEAVDRANVFDIALLGRRLAAASTWLDGQPGWSGAPVGYFGASTGAAAALVAGADLGSRIGAIVSRGGRGDLAGPRLGQVVAPTLLIVGSRDVQVLDLNRDVEAAMVAPCQLEVVDGASHLFEEPGALEVVAGLAAAWFVRHLAT